METWHVSGTLLTAPARVRPTRVGESLQGSHSFREGQQPGLLPFLTAFGCLGCLRRRRAIPGKSRQGRGAAPSENVSPQAMPPQITSRIRLWRALVRGDTHTIGTLAEAAGIKLERSQPPLGARYATGKNSEEQVCGMAHDARNTDGIGTAAVCECKSPLSHVMIVVGQLSLCLVA